MPEVSVYVPKENGDLKFLTDADIDSDTDGRLLIDAFLDENPRNQDDVFVIIDQDAGALEVVEVEDREPVQPRRKIVIRSGGASSNGVAAVEEDDDEDERPSKPKAKARRSKPGPKPGTKKGSTSKSKPKPRAKGSQAKAGRARQSKSKGSKPKGGAFGRKAEDD